LVKRVLKDITVQLLTLMQHMKQPLIFKRSVVFVIIALSVFITSCDKDDPVALSTLKEIVSLSLKKADGTPLNLPEVSISFRNDTINVIVPFNTDRSKVIPEIVIQGKTISPASGTLQDFTSAVKYTVTAEDGSTRIYVINVALANEGGLLYVGSSNKNFYAIDVETGKLKWNYTGSESFAYSSATYANGIVYVGSIDSYVYAFDAITGVVKWKFLAGPTGIESDAVVVDGTVYVGCNDDYLYAIDAVSGQMKWRYLTDANVSASPTVANGVVYFGSSDNKLYALDAASGQLRWSFATDNMINQSGPALVNGVIYVGSRDGYLYAIDANNGNQKWKFYAGGVSLEQSSPTVANGLVYIGGWYDIATFTKKGGLYAVNAVTGQLVWESLANTGISASPTVADGVIYITADDNNIHALSANTGSLIWEKLILPNSASAAVSNKVVYVGGGGTGYIYAFDAKTGSEKWKFAVPSGLATSNPLVVRSTGEADYSGASGIEN
jgi:outer membrane protein assembly factor BamB